MTAMQGLSIAALQAAHIERQDEWCPDQKPALSFRGNELGGECGEAQNVIKKLERERLGWRGSRDTVEHLGEELADVIHCSVLVAITAGIDIERAVIDKFNSTSEKNGLSTFLSALAPQAGDNAWVEELLRKMLDNPVFYTQTSGGGERPKVELVFDDVKNMQRFTEALAEARLYLRKLEGAQ